MVEQLAVNQLVVGSSPTPGATKNSITTIFFYLFQSMKHKLYTINAFSDSAEGGNPAGVLLNADKLSDTEMLRISNKVGFSETAFVMDSDAADYKIKFFTPNSEVDLCGHATISVFSILIHHNIIKHGNFSIETNIGVLEVNISSTGVVFMDQAIPTFYDTIDIGEIAESLNISSELISSKLPIQIVSTGLRDVFIPLKSLNDLNNLNPDFRKILQISKRLNVTGYHVFVPSSDSRVTANCRNFAPLYDINEESATGSASGALACYMFHHRLLDDSDLNNLVFKQGVSMNRPSIINVKLDTFNNQITRVRVGGKCSNINLLDI